MLVPQIRNKQRHASVRRRSRIPFPSESRRINHSPEPKANAVFQKALNDIAVEIANIRRSCETAIRQAGSEEDYLNMRRLQEALAEASHYVHELRVERGPSKRSNKAFAIQV